MDQRLVEAAREGDVNTLLNLLKQDPDMLERASSAHFSDSPLHVAARRGKAEFVNQIVGLKPSLARETNQQGMIPLHLASLEGHVETARELLKAKLDNHQCLVKDEEGWTPLHCASQKGEIGVMEELIRECPQCLKEVTAEGETVLHTAVKANQFEAVKLLAESLRHHNLHTLLKAKDQKGKTAYQLAAAKKLQPQVLEALKEDDGRREECLVSISEQKSESKSQKDAILVVATLIITLTYQALANPPSTFLKGGGSSTIDWACLLDKNLRSHGFIDRLKECPARLALLFIMFNTLIFFTLIYVVVATLRGKNVFSMRFLTLLLALCYSSLLTFYYNAVYFAFPVAFLAFAFFLFPGIKYEHVSVTQAHYAFRKLYQLVSQNELLEDIHREVEDIHREVEDVLAGVRQTLAEIKRENAENGRKLDKLIEMI